MHGENMKIHTANIVTLQINKVKLREQASGKNVQTYIPLSKINSYKVLSVLYKALLRGSVTASVFSPGFSQNKLK